MAQRNPMNERYLGDGPQGKTRKSATKLKPKGEAAASVNIEKKPTNRQERKAARKKRESQLAAKEKERQRKADERERKEREAAGEVLAPKKKDPFFDKVKAIFITPKKDSAAKDDSTEKESQPVLTMPTWHGGPDTTEFRRLKYIYYILMAIGFSAITISIVLSVGFPDVMSNQTLFISMAFAYPAVIGALILDYGKIRKMQKAHQMGGSGRRSPKQLKHAQQQVEAAMLLEESKKAKKEQRRAQSKIPFYGKQKDTDERTSEEPPATDEDIKAENRKE